MGIEFIGVAASFTLAAIGSALGIGTAAQSAVGAWKRCYAANKPAPFALIIYISAPLTQTLYGFILMGSIRDALADPIAKLAVGVLAGIAIGASAFSQGRAGACAADAYGETGKGMANYILALGLIESVAIFVMALMLITVDTLKQM